MEIATQVQELERPIYPDDKIILQANALTGSRHAFTASQLDIFFMLLAQLGENDAPGILYQVYISDIKAITGREWHIQQLRESITQLGCKPFEIIHDEDSGSIYWPFQQLNYVRGKGLIEIKLADEMRPLLFHLKNRYTVLQLKAVLSLTSKYAKRLYALACQWRAVGILTIPIKELKEKLHLIVPGKKEKLERFDNFKSQVLDESKQQINALTDLEIDYDLIQRKGSKAYEAVKFYIGVRKPKQLEIDFHKPIEQQKEISYITAYGISEAVAEKMAKHFNFFLKTVEEVKRDMREGKEIKDIAAYIVGIFKKQNLLK